MKIMFKVLLLGVGCVLMLLVDLEPLATVPDAEAQYGSRNRTRRRSSRRTAVVVGSAGAAQTQQAEAEAAAAKQQAAESEAEAEAAKQQAAAAEAEAEAAKQEAAAAKAATAPSATEPLPLGTVVTTLPDGCTTETSGGQQYYRCGSNYFKAAFQGSQLVYVTAQP